MTVRTLTVGHTLHGHHVGQGVLDEWAFVMERKLLSHCVQFEGPPVVDDQSVCLPVVFYCKGRHEPTAPEIGVDKEKVALNIAKTRQFYFEP